MRSGVRRRLSQTSEFTRVAIRVELIGGIWVGIYSAVSQHNGILGSAVLALLFGWFMGAILCFGLLLARIVLELAGILLMGSWWEEMSDKRAEGAPDR